MSMDDRPKASQADESSEAAPKSCCAASGGGPFGFRDLLWWFPACVVVAMAVACVSSVAEGFFAPPIIFPLLVGTGLGAVLVAIMRIGQIGHRPSIIAGLLLATAVVVPGQHYLSYRSTRQAILANQEKLDAIRQAFPDQAETRLPVLSENFADFMQREAARGRPLPGKRVARGVFAWISWGFDWLLTLVACGGIVVLAVRQPYCSRCRSWYRTIRNGRIDGETAAQLAELVGIEISDEPFSARYRMLNCNGGCGPTEFELSWESSSSLSAPPIWIDAECRNRMMQILDRAEADGRPKDGGPKDGADEPDK
jgi:hypothetical protein